MKVGQELRAHTCYLNWSGSSSATEADILVEGFCHAEEMRGLRYSLAMAIALRDSSQGLRVGSGSSKGRVCKSQCEALLVTSGKNHPRSQTVQEDAQRFCHEASHRRSPLCN